MRGTARESGGFTWEDCTGTFQVCGSIAQGGGIWPSMVNVDAEELSGSITSEDARELALLLVNAANACDVSTARLLGGDEQEPGEPLAGRH